MAERKRVSGVYEAGSEHWVGDGFPVRNLFPSNGVENEINPFLMLDYAGPTHFEPSAQPRGVESIRIAGSRPLRSPTKAPWITGIRRETQGRSGRATCSG